MYSPITHPDPLTRAPGDASAMPAGVTADDTLWARVIGDGTSVRVKCINQSTPPAESAWSNTGVCYSSSDFDLRGGRVGFFNPYFAWVALDPFTLKTD